MTPETLELYAKYRYFLYLLSNERLFYFLNEDTKAGLHPAECTQANFQFALSDKEHLDYDKFFNTYNHVITWHWCIKPRWRDYKKRRAYLIKKFEYGKYNILLSSKFCYDVKILILSYIMKK